MYKDQREEKKSLLGTRNVQRSSSSARLQCKEWLLRFPTYAMWVAYNAALVPGASWQITGGTFEAIGAADKPNQGIWPPELRPDEVWRWLIASFGGLATASLYWKLNPIQTDRSLKENFVRLYSLFSMSGLFAILASIPGSVLTLMDTRKNSDLSPGMRDPIAYAAAICCFIVTVVTYYTSLTKMATALKDVVKTLWHQPGQNKALLTFAILMAIASLATVPGLMASVAVIVKGWGAPAGVAAAGATLLTIPFYILLLQSCIDCFKKCQDALSQRTITGKTIIASVAALVPGTIIASAFLFFTSQGLGKGGLNWVDGDSKENLTLSIIGAIPTLITFSDSSYSHLMKPLVDKIYRWVSWGWSCVPSCNPRSYVARWCQH